MHLDEHSRLQLREVRREARHPAGRVVFGEAIRREDVRVLIRAGLVRDRVVRVLVDLAELPRRIGALCVERVAERRLVRLVVRRKRPVLEPLRNEEPALSVGLHDERVVAADRVRASRVVGRDVVRRLLLVEVRCVGAGPLLLLAVPPDELLALRPRLALGVR